MAPCCLHVLFLGSTSHPQCYVAFYLDEGNVIGPHFELERIVPELRERLTDIGLELDMRKSKLFTKGDLTTYPELREIPTSTQGLEVLGFPFGESNFVRERLRKKFDSVMDFCRRVSTLGEPQIAASLLRLCAGTCRVLHLIKVVQPDLMAPFLSEIRT